MYASSATPNEVLEYPMFGTAERAVSGSNGLRMRGGNGMVLFDSGRKGLRRLQAAKLPTVPDPPVEIAQLFPGVDIGIAIPSSRLSYN